MLNWIRNKLRDWLREQPPDDPYLDVLVAEGEGEARTTRIVKVLISGRRGMSLVGQSVDGAFGERVVRERDAVDKAKFGRLLDGQLSGAELTWENEWNTPSS